MQAINDVDTAQRFILEQGDVRGELVHLHNSYKTIMSQHDYPPVVKRILGEVLVATVLLTSTLKFEGELTMQMQSDGPIQLLVTKCTNNLGIRALAEWRTDVSEQQLVRAFGEGNLAITIRPDNAANFYQSIVPLQNRSVAHAIEHYFYQSEQLATRIWLAVNDEYAGGMLLQLMPGTDTTEREDYWQHITMLADTITGQELLTLDNERILQRLYPTEDMRIFAAKPVNFRCRCSIEKMQDAILTLGEVEANLILKDKQYISVTCEYCGREYSFDRIDVAHIFLTKKPPDVH